MRRTFAIAVLILAVVLGGAGLAFFRPDIDVETLRRTYAGPASHFLTVDRLTVHYRDQGRADAPVLVMLHGAMSSLQTWDGWAKALKDDFRLISVDLPGHGLTGPWPAPRPGALPPDYSRAGYVRFVEHFVDALKLQRFSLAGNSMGGAIAWSYAARHPARVTHLILIDSAGYEHNGETPLPVRLAHMAVVGDLLRYATPHWAVARQIREVYADPAKVTDALVQRYEDLMRRAGNREALLERLRTPQRTDTAALRNLTMPVLIMWGAQDRWIVPADAFRFQQDIAKADLKIYRDAGHVPMEEQPVETAADARAFLLSR